MSDLTEDKEIWDDYIEKQDKKIKEKKDFDELKSAKVLDETGIKKVGLFCELECLNLIQKIDDLIKTHFVLNTKNEVVWINK